MSRKAKDVAEIKRQAEEESEEAADSPTTVIEVNTVVRGTSYRGTFVFRVPSIKDQITIGQMKALYLPNGATADPASATLVEQICYLEVCLGPDRPNWWKPMEFKEGDLLALVYQRGIAYANKFLGRDKGDAEDSGSDGIEDSGGNPPDDESNVVEEVSAPNKSSSTLIHDSSGAE